MESYFIALIVLLLVIGFSGWLPLASQEGGGSIAPGVFDQLYDKGPMDLYLTGPSHVWPLGYSPISPFYYGDPGYVEPPGIPEIPYWYPRY